VSEKETVKTKDQEATPETMHVKKQVKRYTGEKNKKETPKLNETETGPRKSRGKKQRRQFKLPPTEDKRPLL
jgi:hypothetical protein